MKEKRKKGTNNNKGKRNLTPPFFFFFSYIRDSAGASSSNQHLIFYAMCQCLFYVLCFRVDELLQEQVPTHMQLFLLMLLSVLNGNAQAQIFLTAEAKRKRERNADFLNLLFFCFPLCSALPLPFPPLCNSTGMCSWARCGWRTSSAAA